MVQLSPCRSVAPLVGDVDHDGIWDVVRAVSEMTSFGRVYSLRPKAGLVNERNKLQSVHRYAY